MGVHRHDPTSRAARLARSLTALVAAALLAGTAPAPAAVSVDLELVLAVDVSGSMDREEQTIQRDGYVAAIACPEFWSAVRTGAWQRIAVTYVEWAGRGEQTVVVPWRLVDSPEAARRFAGELADRPISQIHATSISGAIDFAAGLFDGNGFDGWRRVIDISGDGSNNQGGPVAAARDAALARGIVINGLPLLLRPATAGTNLDTYFSACVIGGPGSFSLPVRSEAEFASAIRRKLALEVAGRTPLRVIAAQLAVADCNAGGWLP